MSESLLGRVARLVGGTFTAMVDAAENTAPELVARQAVEEIDHAIDDVRAEIGRKQAARHNANRELSSLNDRAENLKDQIQTALTEKREDLAEAGVEELVGIEDRIPIIESLVAGTQEESQELEKYLAGLRSKREDMEKDLQLIRQQQVAKEQGSHGQVVPGQEASSDVESRVEKASNAVARVKSAVSGMPNQKEVSSAATRAELEELHRKNRVSERLAALKKEA